MVQFCFFLTFNNITVGFVICFLTTDEGKPLKIVVYIVVLGKELSIF